MIISISNNSSRPEIDLQALSPSLLVEP